ncbi:cell division protein ZapA [Tenuibacillus multivorans]|uniref:Cell division protein ZapA n=1 Tax=Tenuibacillus multivorans TaxID=237069 RepID=A0A1G9ZSW0_9BACI|nr:cell division protein ZapA [Tenuibacillus multivorans]GEL76815.1 cell division protein ZapA [Tenuibacillus multivorans]SDN23616.1 cell division protein ZapA [Tenuibacillus multivorans]
MPESDKNRITVEISNRKFTVVGEESAEHIKMVASLVDQKMDELRYAKPTLDTSQLAVLTALNTMSDYLKLKEEHNALVQKERKEDRK